MIYGNQIESLKLGIQYIVIGARECLTCTLFFMEIAPRKANATN